MTCTSCGGILPHKSDICRYCGRVNDTDLRALPRATPSPDGGPRECPRCACPLQALDLPFEKRLCIDRCTSCFGIFFDSGELEFLFETSISHVYEADIEKLHSLVAEEASPESRVVYCKCPGCSKVMNRRHYGLRSGVIVDVCRSCGVWLDGGELRKLLKWYKAGGQLHTESVLAERTRLARLDEERRRKQATTSAATFGDLRTAANDLTVLAEALSTFVLGVK